MTDPYHNPVVQHKSLYGLKVLQSEFRRPGGHRPPYTSMTYL
jgi:hypothetical protein